MEKTVTVRLGTNKTVTDRLGKYKTVTARLGTNKTVTAIASKVGNLGAPGTAPPDEVPACGPLMA